MSDISSVEGIKKHSNRPKDSRFHQQRLKAWHPILTAKSVFPFFLTLGVVFIPLGVLLLITSNRVLETVVEYTHCEDRSRSTTSRCSEIVRLPEFYKNYNICSCVVEFELKQNYKGKVYFYYGLSNFFQNHRRYVISKDDNQLHGSVGKLNADCEPYRKDSQGREYAPCGAIAMSLFNDTFKLNFHKQLADGNIQKIEVPMTNKGIAWRTDVERKYGKPPPDSWASTTKPVSWPKSALQRSSDAYSGDEDLLVWMRVAALPTFRKLYRIISNSGDFVDGLPVGKYSVDIGYAYPVTQFGGTKRFVISTMSWLGGRNPTLGIAYLTVGSITLILGLIFLFLHIYIPRRIDK